MSETRTTKWYLAGRPLFVRPEASSRETGFTRLLRRAAQAAFRDPRTIREMGINTDLILGQSRVCVDFSMQGAMAQDFTVVLHGNEIAKGQIFNVWDACEDMIRRNGIHTPDQYHTSNRSMTFLTQEINFCDHVTVTTTTRLRHLGVSVRIKGGIPNLCLGPTHLAFLNTFRKNKYLPLPTSGWSPVVIPE